MNGTLALNQTVATPSDSELVVAALRGDPPAREELAIRLRRPAYLLALQLLGRPDEAMDVAQDSVLRVFGALNRFDTDRPLKPWLYQIVRNRVRDLARRRRVRREESLEAARDAGAPEIRSPAPGPEAAASSAELQRLIWAAIQGLTPAQREILVLRDYQDLSYAEVSEVLDVPIGTVMSRLHRARRALRSRLPEELHPGGTAGSSEEKVR